MGILDTVASAAAGPLGPLLQVGSKLLDKVIPDPASKLTVPDVFATTFDCPVMTIVLNASVTKPVS